MTNLPPGHAAESKDNTALIQANIRADIYNFFQRMAFKKGWRQQIVCHLMEKLFDAAQTADLVPYWDGDNESKLAALLSRLNFEDVAALKARVAQLESQPVTSAVRKPRTKKDVAA